MFYIGAFVIVFLAFWGTFYAVLPTLWGLIQRLAGGAAVWVQRWRRGRSVVTYASRFRDYGPVILILILGALGTMVVGDAFMDLGE